MLSKQLRGMQMEILLSYYGSLIVKHTTYASIYVYEEVVDHASDCRSAVSRSSYQYKALRH